MALTVRTANIEDVVLLCSMGSDIFYETYAVHNTPENMRQYMAETYNSIAISAEVEDSSTEIFIAQFNDEPAGYVKISTTNECKELADKTYFEIERLYVYSKYQGQKIGYALINACVAYARQNAYNTIWLGVWERNTKAIHFYERLGFHKFGEHVFKLGEDLQNDHLMMLEVKG